MARFTFGGTYEDRIETQDGNSVVHAAPGSTLTFWSAITGGTQYTDLLLNGGAVTTMTADSNGFVPLFSGPDAITTMYVSADGSARKRMDSPVSSAAFVQITNRPVTLKDTAGIDFTGATNSATALQAAITAAGDGAIIQFGRPGVIRCDTGLTLRLFQQLDGGSTYLGAGSTAPGELRFTNIGATGVGVTGFSSGNNILRNLLVRGPMTGANTTVGFSSAAGAHRFYNVGFYGWATGTSLTAAFYSLFDSCEWSGNKTALLTSGCYNLHLTTPRFNCLYNTSSLGTGINGAARGMKITAGSIENYGSTGAVIVNSNQVLNLDGTYFESSSASSGAFGILAAGVDKAVVNARGCTVMLTEHNRWLHMSTSTNFTVNANGNKFVCPTSSSTAPIAYYLAAADVGNVMGRIGRDDWSEVLKSGALYIPASLTNLGQVPDLEYRLPGTKYLGGDIAGTGTPEAVVPGPIGAVYRRLDGSTSTSLYVKTSGTGTTGWTAK